jgi:hypothetical protein
MSKLQLTSMRHPEYRERNPDWRRWRLAYQGGRAFINQYLERYSKREDVDEFQARKKMTYCPRFAGAAVDDVKNSIYQRMTDIVRVGGHKSYQDAVAGVDGGVDLEGSNMNRFIGQLVLPELLVTGKVGVYVDMPANIGPTLADNLDKRPYLYYYCAEDIADWNCAYEGSEKYFTSLLLRDNETEYDDVTGLALGTKTLWRLYQLTPDGVEVQFLNNKNETISQTVLTGLDRIPFVMLEINKPLMEDIADYQIALMNLESSDINYMLKSNFPFYVEQYDPRAEMNFGRPAPDQVEVDPNFKKKEVVAGNTTGRRYPIGAERPGFIHPSAEPLTASMAKEDRIKQDMRKLLSLSLTYLEPKFASAQSKGMDDRSLEAGLSSLGLLLQYGENQIAQIWAGYLNSEAALVHYPRSYSLKSEDERRAEAKSDAELLATVPSRSYQKEISKKIAHTMLAHMVSPETLDTIMSEIDDAKYMSGVAQDIKTDLDSGLVTEETASQARGYAEGEVAKARTQHAERLARIQKAQSPQPGSLNNPGARGNPDANPVPGNPNPDNTERSNGATGK